MEPLLDAGEVARILKISKRTLESMIARGEGPLMIMVGRQRRWMPDDLTMWIEDRRNVIDKSTTEAKENSLHIPVTTNRKQEPKM